MLSIIDGGELLRRERQDQLSNPDGYHSTILGLIVCALP